MQIESERLAIFPVSDAEMRALTEGERDPGLKKAYGEMLQGSVNDPGNRVWYAVWYMERKDLPGTVIGDLSFKGPPAEGAVELGYGLREGCCGRGYMTEAVRRVTEWALAQPGVSRVEAETDPENLPSQRVLLAAGFLPTGELGEEGPRFSRPA